MESFIAHDTNYIRIIKKDDNTLIKYSPVSKDGWEKIKEKNLKSLNTPIKIETLSQEERQNHWDLQTKIELPYLKHHETLEYNQSLRNLTTKQLLLLMKEIIEKVKQMHKAEIYHTDLHSGNIMIDKKDIKIIDLDAVLVSNYISPENIHEEDDISFEEKIKLSKEDDKISILNLLLYYLKKGTFQNQMNDFIDIQSLDFPKNIKKEIIAYQLGRADIDQDYYYEDIIEELIKKGYESPKLRTRSK